jgi:hypothetical protein
MENGLSLDAVVIPAVIGGWFCGIVLLMCGSLVARRLLVWMLLWTFLAAFLPLWGQVAMAVGKHAADAMVGSLAADLVRFIFKILILPLIVVRTLLGREQ